MRIHFFEEYPTYECLSLAAQLDAPCTIFLAAPNAEAFADAATRLKRWNASLEAAFWPILPRSYWLSPFAHVEELEALRASLSELRAAQPEGTSLGVLLDLELPLLQRQLFWRNLGSFRRGKAALRQIFEDAKEPGLSLYTAEYPLPYRWGDGLLRGFGVGYPQLSAWHTRIPMLYTSIFPRRRWAEWLGKRMLGRRQAQLTDVGGRFFVGLGTIATGVFGNEPILSPADLDADLQLLQSYGVSDAVIFRLGGITPDLLSVIRAYTK